MKLTLGDIAKLTSAEVFGDPGYTIAGVADLDSAAEQDLSFLARNQFGGTTRNYEGLIKKSKAGAFFVDKDIERAEGPNYLVVENPSLAFQQTAEKFHPPAPSGFEGVHPAAVIHPEAEIAEGVTIGPCAVIDRGAEIGQGSVIGAQVFVGSEVTIGRDCKLHVRVSVHESCQLGDRVEIQSGAVIGSCGFGYTTDEKGVHHKIKQLGNVVLEDDVEVGANTTIDRARLKTTIIRRGTKIDNLVQIAHNVELGEGNLIVAQVGIAGSTKTGRHVVLGGQTGVNGHIELCDGTIVAARSGVMGTIKEPGKYYGEPAQPIAKYRRFWMNLLRLDKAYKRIDALEEKLK